MLEGQEPDPTIRGNLLRQGFQQFPGGILFPGVEKQPGGRDAVLEFGDSLVEQCMMKSHRLGVAHQDTASRQGPQHHRIRRIELVGDAELVDGGIHPAAAQQGIAPLGGIPRPR